MGVWKAITIQTSQQWAEPKAIKKNKLQHNNNLKNNECSLQVLTCHYIVSCVSVEGKHAVNIFMSSSGENEHPIGHFITHSVTLTHKHLCECDTVTCNLPCGCNFLQAANKLSAWQINVEADKVCRRLNYLILGQTTQVSESARYLGHLQYKSS